MRTKATVREPKRFDSLHLELDMDYNEAVTLFAMLHKVIGGAWCEPLCVVEDIRDALDVAFVDRRVFDPNVITGSLSLPPRFSDLVL